MKVLRSMLKESKSKILQFEHANGFRICLEDKTVVKRIAPAFPGPFVIFLRCVDNRRRLYFVRHPCPPARLLPYSYHFQYILPHDTIQNEIPAEAISILSTLEIQEFPEHID